MHTHSDHWLPLAEYAMRTGTSISTLRRKIKSEAIPYKMEEGRYLLRLEEAFENEKSFTSSDLTHVPVASGTLTKEAVEDMVRKSQEENALRWRALEARVNGLSRKLDYVAEQLAEMKMLVKLFEEKLDARS